MSSCCQSLYEVLVDIIKVYHHWINSHLYVLNKINNFKLFWNYLWIYWNRILWLTDTLINVSEEKHGADICVCSGAVSCPWGGLRGFFIYCSPEVALQGWRRSDRNNRSISHTGGDKAGEDQEVGTLTCRSYCIRLGMPEG